MATETFKLMRSENSPWGFRLSGGKDFGVILTVQKVNPGSIASDTGIQCGDVVLSINGQDTAQLRHKEAQDAVLNAGNVLEIIVQRGGASSFKPSVAKQKSSEQSQNMNNQYNNYIDQTAYSTIAQTLTSHAEMIAPGVMGINFMKPESPVNTRSEVYRLVQEEQQNKANSPTPPAGPVSPPVISPRRSAPPAKTPPPVSPKPTVPVNIQPTPPPPAFMTKKPATPPAQSVGTCSDCGRYITSAFVRVGERMLHEDCFRCSTCGSSLQNTGYASINNKLYCELHAKLAAKVIVAEMDSMPHQNFSDIPTPAALPQNAAPSAPVTPPAMPAAPAPFPIAPSSFPTAPSPFPPATITGPTPYISPTNLPQTPSSSGGLTFRSISPQPFKRISGDFHKVTAPSSPTPPSGPTFIHDSTGSLPFEMKPYMPASQSMSSYQAASQTSIQTSHVSQSIQQTTMVSQHSSQLQMDYKQVIGQQSTKFVWPPPKPEDILNERKVGVSAPAPAPTQQHYSPLATQSSPPESIPKNTPQSVPETYEAPPEPPATQNYVPPPLPTTTFPKSDDVPVPTITSAPEPKPSVTTSNSAPGFAPVLPPVADTDAKKDGLGGVPQSGVPTGAGSRPAPRRGKGQLKEQIPGCRIPICADCGSPIRGPFVIALGKTWCPEHFHCNNLHCKAHLEDIGFVEEQGQLYCENCYEAFLAPVCNKCGTRIKGDCLNALDKPWHPECFLCAYCHKAFGNSSFYLEDGLPYCEKDWNELFTTKCVQCGYPIEAGDRWVEALNNNYHSQCFKCSICSKNLEGQSFFAKGGRPFCKAHAR